MESWQDIQREALETTEAGQILNFDRVRRSAYDQLVALTGRPLIVYASAHHNQGKVQLAGNMLAIDYSDKDGFQEVLRNIEGPAVDIFVHSPGGSAEATESIVAILRSKFNDIRFIVTGSAKSAATMLVMSGDKILMNNAGELGPTDPQMLMGRGVGRYAPAGSVLDQFNLAKKEVAANSSLIAPWTPILQQYGPSLLVECKNHIKLSEKLVAGWLEHHLFRGQSTPKKKAQKLGRYLANDKNFLSHGRRVDITALRNHGAIIDCIEDLPEDHQIALRRIHLSVMATLDASLAIKIFENNGGAVLIRQLPPPISTGR